MAGLAPRWLERPLALLASISLVAGACGGAATTTPTAAPETAAPMTAAPATRPAAEPAAEPRASTAPSRAAEGACTNMPASPVTLRYWEAAGEYLSEEGVATLDAEFQQAHPNVRLSRVAKPFAEIMAAGKRQATGPDSPDILLTNVYDHLGPLVAANLVLPLDDHAARFGWQARFGESVLRVQRFSPDGRRYGTGRLYGLSPAATYVGLFYNRDVMTRLGLQVPTTYEELLETLEAARKHNVVPIAAGIRDSWPAMDMFSSLQDITAPPGQVRSFVFRTSPDARFDTPENIEAAALAQELGRMGYYSPGYRDRTHQEAIDEFVAGKALYFLRSTAFAGPIREGLGDQAAMILFPGRQGGPFAVTGAPGFSWSISTKSEHPDAAACYLDWRTGRRASELLVAEGGLPSMILEHAGDSQLTKSILDGWAEIAQRDALVPYLAWAATDLHDTLSAATQQLVADELSPDEFARQVQQAYERLTPGS
jgi:raffinose/stachyose/melibiose transport system substrate-binding protein